MLSRKLACAVFATLAAVWITLGNAGAQAKRTLSISIWGFNGDILERELFKPFKEKYNVDIVLETGNNADRLNKIRIRRGQGVDIVYLADSFAQTGIDEGLFAKIDRARIPNAADLYPIAARIHGDYGPAYTVGRYGIIYDAAAVKAPVASWNDLWRDEFKNRASIPGIATTAGPLIVIAAAERKAKDPFKDPDAAFSSLSELKPNVVKVYNTGSELVNLFAQKEIVIAAAQDFVFANIKAAVPTAQWAELKEGPFANMNTINVVAASPNKDLAEAFINWHLDPGVQKTMAVLKVDAPVNRKVELTPQEAAIWTYGEAMIGKLRTPDYAKLNQVKSDWIDRWNERFGR
jgi:putative spermidine/putrescine transport system substrate-binding protein